MAFPQELTERLLEFVLDNHTTILVCSTSVQDELRNEEQQTLRTGIANILAAAFERPYPKKPPSLPVTTAITEATEAIWSTVLGSFDDNVWLTNDERIVFFDRWETDLKESVEELLTKLVEDL